MKNILREIGVSEKQLKLSQIPKKPKSDNKVKRNIPLLEDYNFMADVLELPETSKKFRYLLVVVDIASDEFDCAPMRDRSSATVRDAIDNMFRHSVHIKKPKGSIRTDGGSEFEKSFHEYLTNNGIFHKVAVPYRHKQLANVEKLNSQLASLLWGYMNKKQRELNQRYYEWTDILDIVIEKLNAVRKKNLPNEINPEDYLPDENGNARDRVFAPERKPKFKIGDFVHEILEYPQDVFGRKQLTDKFRQGDMRWHKNAKKIKHILYFSDYPYYRYILNGKPHVSYSEYELLKSDENNEIKDIRKVLNRRTNADGSIDYRISYSNDSPKWVSREQLIQDGYEFYINEYEELLEKEQQEEEAPQQQRRAIRRTQAEILQELQQQAEERDRLRNAQANARATRAQARAAARGGQLKR